MNMTPCADKPRVLFIDRDGTLIIEPPIDFQVDSLEKLRLYPGALRGMHFIAHHLPFKLVMVTNQDGLGTDSFPEDTFYPAHNKMLDTFADEGVNFDEIIIDRTFEHENAPTRKPGIELLKHFLNGDYDIANSFVIGDRLTDVKLAQNLGCKAILLQPSDSNIPAEYNDTIVLCTSSWDRITDFLQGGSRQATVVRNTRETKITVSINLDGNGKADISTGLGFFDHMLEQIPRHSGIDLSVHTVGDLNVDEHHTIEDTGLALGEAFSQAIGDKRGIERYGFVLPMDDCLATVAIDFGGRPWLVWDATFNREKIGDVPTEMFFHFFKSFSDNARINLFIRAEGNNEHHKIEGIFKALARAIKNAIRRDQFHFTLPSTKGAL
jgi:imidazoleglycerol-phosphate dehydratase/histidinol-phosphatase